MVFTSTWSPPSCVTREDHWLMLVTTEIGPEPCPPCSEAPQAAVETRRARQTRAATMDGWDERRLRLGMVAHGLLLRTCYIRITLLRLIINKSSILHPVDSPDAPGRHADGPACITTGFGQVRSNATREENWIVLKFAPGERNAGANRSKTVISRDGIPPRSGRSTHRTGR